MYGTYHLDIVYHVDNPVVTHTGRFTNRPFPGVCLMYETNYLEIVYHEDNPVVTHTGRFTNRPYGCRGDTE